MQCVPPGLHALRADSPAAPLQTHLLPAVPGDHVPGTGQHPHSGLPALPPPYLHWPQPRPAGGTVGGQQAVGADTRGGGGEGHWTGGGGQAEGRR